MTGNHGPTHIGRAERVARAAVGMPAEHPELITRKPGCAEWQQLSIWLAEMWPDYDYIAVIADKWNPSYRERESNE